MPQGNVTTVRLRRGELLYLPRGFLHQGKTSNEMSAHLTIGVNPITWAQVIHKIVDRLEQTDPDFRRSVRTAERAGGNHHFHRE